MGNEAGFFPARSGCEPQRIRFCLDVLKVVKLKDRTQGSWSSASSLTGHEAVGDKIPP